MLNVPEQADIASLSAIVEDIALHTDQKICNASGFGAPEERHARSRRFLRQRREPVDRATQVRRPSRHADANRRRNRQHDGRRAVATARTRSGEVPARNGQAIAAHQLERAPDGLLLGLRFEDDPQTRARRAREALQRIG